MAACDNVTQSPRIIPNVGSLRYQKMVNQFETSRNFSKSGNIPFFCKLSLPFNYNDFI